jgi:hypothetical protein
MHNTTTKDSSMNLETLPPEIVSLAKEVAEYQRPLGYVHPPVTVVRELSDRARTILDPLGLTPLSVYCRAAVVGDLAVQTLALILGA